MKILAISKIIGPPEETAERRAELLKAEIEGAWRLRQQDVIREIYIATDLPAAVLILETSTLDEARRSLTTLPMVAQGLVTFELTRLAPYSRWEALFAARPAQ